MCSLRVCYFGTYDQFNPRNDLTILGLRENDVDVVECHVDLWLDTADKVAWTRNGCLSILTLLLKLISTYARLIVRYSNTSPHDVIVVGYAGQVDVFVAKALGILRRKPVVLDSYQSIHDTMVFDRGLVTDHSVKALLAFVLDKWSCRVADIVLLDTDAHVERFCSKYGLQRKKFRRACVSADDRVFRPIPGRSDKKVFKVMYFGGYVPLHGTDVIVRAAERLSDQKEISFIMIGNGQDFAATKALSQHLGLSNLVFLETDMPGKWLSSEQLREHIAEADICLGVFGRGQKADWVIPSKVCVALAMEKPVVTGDSRAVRETLVDGESVLLCERGNPDALANAILLLWQNEALRTSLAFRGRQVFLQTFSPGVLGRDLKAVLKQLYEERGAGRK